jgi:hypothetical protein
MEQIHQIVDNERRLKWWFDEHTKLIEVDSCYIYCPYVPLEEPAEKEKLAKKG